MGDMPQDPMNGLQVAVTALHEIFLQLTAGGFTEKQALRYLAYYSVISAEQSGEQEQ